MTQSHAQPEHRPHDKRLAQSPNELANPLVARLPRLVYTQGFLAAEVQRQVGAFHVDVGLELGHDLGGDGGVASDASVEADPGALFLELDAAAPCARAGFVREHGGSPVVNKGKPCPRAGRRWTPLGVAWKADRRPGAAKRLRRP